MMLRWLKVCGNRLRLYLGMIRKFGGKTNSVPGYTGGITVGGTLNSVGRSLTTAIECGLQA